MKRKADWPLVWKRLEELASIDKLADGEPMWRAGQQSSLRWVGARLEQQPGVLIADEVGLGKTRLAIAVAICVAASGGRAVVMIPPGLTYQWCEEELRGFLEQLRALKLDWIPAQLLTKVLRTFPDLFGTKTQPSRFPLSDDSSIIFMSHRFGVPLKMVADKKPEIWAIPFLLKKKLLEHGGTVRGAGKLKIPPEQECALNWLANRLSPSMQTKLKALGPVSPSSLQDPQAKAMFGNLIGQLVGDFDLIVIDEAHKNRLGANHSSSELDSAAPAAGSRMSDCLANIILHPNSQSKNAKRIALTATPMEMDAEQWTGVLFRIGLDKAAVDALKSTVTEFADSVKNLRSGTDAELERLENAAEHFQQHLGALVTRRLWRDHPAVQSFAQQTRAADCAHPHRRMHAAIVPINTLSQLDRHYLACSEGLAMASKGMITAHSLKSAGSRYSQGLPLPLLSEGRTEPESKARKSEDTDATAKSQLVRQAYWHAHLNDLSASRGAVSAEPEWYLQWHPKVRHAITLIEQLGSEGRKVLVFGEFLNPMHALDRALNIRHYLRQIRNGKAALLPVRVKADDPDLLLWLKEMAFPPADIAAFPDTVISMAERYRSERRGLRDLCNLAVDTIFSGTTSRGATISEPKQKTLVTWLVQQLCVNDQLVNARGSKGRELVRAAVDLLLLELSDNDPEDQGVSAPADDLKKFNWNAAIAQQEKDMERDVQGNVEYRISPFSQLMVGEVKPATRRVRQSSFNNNQLNPQVLIAQTAVASEGLNLHRECRSVVLFHLDWNPGRIEQQIGRVDRQDSAWMKDFSNWNGVGVAPYIDIYTIALEGTYDAFRTEVVRERAKVLRSQLFGEVLPLDQLTFLPEATQRRVGKIKVDFRPE